MAVALEARAPFLDYRVAELAWSLPPHMKRRNGESGSCAACSIASATPPRRTAQDGFLGADRSLAARTVARVGRDLLAPARLAADGLFDAARVARLWDEHQAGRVSRQTVLWNLLMFQFWREHYRSRA